uniref:Hydrolase n=1 Tax=Thermosporothrix sp. COM3 TaxID=2490863 RepID=A0A455SHH3_9CHLR|nr:hydrolase [Thermosporothrix sp. COM3]
MQKNTHRCSGFAEVNGTRLYFEMAGKGRPLVLLHGHFLNHTLWNMHFDVLAQHYRVLRFDLRGFGQSAPYLTEPRPFFWHEDLWHLLHYFELKPASLIGFSLGGKVALDFALSQPDMVESLVLVSTGVSGFHIKERTRGKPLEDAFHSIEQALEQEDLERAADLCLRTWTIGPHRTEEQVSARVRNFIRRGTLHQWMNQSHKVLQPLEPAPPAFERLEEVQAPTLILAGTQDVPASVELAEILRKRIRRARRVLIPDAAHHLILEHPELFNRIVLDFLATYR